MGNYHEIDLETWNRKDHFNFFKEFDIPFFNTTANVDVTQLVTHTKQKGYSFFLSALYFSLKAAHKVESFRYRILDGKVICYDKVHPGTTAINEENIFKYTYLTYQDDLVAFVQKSQKDLEEQMKAPGLLPNSGLDVIYYSSLPWISFTSFQHARKFIKDESIPRIMFGKYFTENGIIKMPVSVEVNHALMDGYHVGQFFEIFQELLLQSE